MRRAGHQPSAAVSTTFTTPSAESLNQAATAEPASSTSTCPPHDVEVLLSPAGTFESHQETGLGIRNERHRHLAIAIRQRIESRLAGRIHDLAVRVTGNRIVLEGRCATYYTKQLAQHAALGVLEEEVLENAIVVAVPR